MTLSAPLIMLTGAATLALLKIDGSTRLICLSLMWASAATAFAIMPARTELPVDRILWGFVIGTAALGYLPEAFGTKLAPFVCSASGAICGATIKAAGAPPQLLILVGAVAAILVPTRRWPLFDWGVKVVCSWIIAVAALAVTLPLMTTPGNQRDHME